MDGRESACIKQALTMVLGNAGWRTSRSSCTTCASPATRAAATETGTVPFVVVGSAHQHSTFVLLSELQSSISIPDIAGHAAFAIRHSH